MEVAASWSPGLPPVAAAPAAPVASGLPVMGALTTTTDVDVEMEPSERVA